MGVDFYTCRVCKETYPDCGSILTLTCAECDEIICSICYEKHFLKCKVKYYAQGEYGVENEDGDLLGEFCPLCNPKGTTEPIVDMGARTKQDIEKALEDSEEYYKKNFPEMNFNAPVIALSEIEKGIKALAVSNEICTLKWVLGKGKLNCYGDKDDKTKGM